MRRGLKGVTVVVGTVTLAWCAVAESAAAATVAVEFDGGLLRLVYAAGAGERNDVVLRRMEKGRRGYTEWTVVDTGAVVGAGKACAVVDAHTARCVSPAGGGGFRSVDGARVGLGDLDDRLAVTTDVIPSGLVADGGIGHDEISGSPGQDQLVGGVGDDRLFGGVGNDRLKGGGGSDAVYGQEGFDFLDDGDRDGPGEAPGSDTLDAGADGGQVSYGRRRVGVTVDLADPEGDGATGEGDRLSGVTDVVGGRGDDWLAGDDRANVLRAGGAGDDTLIGRGGRDYLYVFGGANRASRLFGGAGDDNLWGDSARIVCGAGFDVVLRPRARARLERDCERVAFSDYDDRYERRFTALPMRDGSLRYRVHCPLILGLDSEHRSRCSARVRVREASRPHRLLASGDLPTGAWAEEVVKARLTPLGLRLASRAAGVLATMKITGRLMGSRTHWTITLKARR
jgi:hemolysin type calcium-binding protein